MGTRSASSPSVIICRAGSTADCSWIITTRAPGQDRSACGPRRIPSPPSTTCRSAARDRFAGTGRGLPLMSGTALALVLTAALVHSGWNALAKRAGNPLAFLWSSVTLATLIFLPLSAGFLRDGLPASAVPYVIGTIVIHAAYFYALGRALGSGDFSLVYPIARGLGVGLVPVGALLWLGERLSPLGATGVGLVVIGIVLANVAAGGGRRRPGGGAGEGAGRGVVTGAAIGAVARVVNER